MNLNDIKNAIRDIPDFPKPGIIFKDITPVLSNPDLFKSVIDLFVEKHINSNISKIAAIDARGFIIGGAIAHKLGIGFVPIRKKGKLPYKTFEESYELEYGEATLAIHQDAFQKGDNVVLIDDLLATGGTALASANLIKKANGNLVSIDFIIELSFLNGREKLKDYEIFSLINY